MSISEAIQLSDGITKQPVVFFLGAGSSVPLGMPTTLSFRKVLVKKSGRKGREIINALYKSAAYRYHTSEDHINIEDFLEFLHELKLGLWILSSSEIGDPISRTLSTIPRESWNEAALKVTQLQWTIYRLLHETCGDCSPQRVGELWNPIINGLGDLTTVFPIFTLNYDWTFERLCIAYDDLFRLTDGFTSALGGNWSPERFLRFTPSPDRVDICLFKLHGPTCWVGDIKSLGAFDSFEEPKHGFESQEEGPFEVVYPGYQREVWLGKESWSVRERGIREREPYSLLYQHLDECLTNTRVVVVIGYAFQDREINASFANAFQKNKEVHFIVLAPGRSSITEATYELPYQWTFDCMDLEPNVWKRLHWIRGRFGPRSSAKKLLATVKKYL